MGFTFLSVNKDIKEWYLIHFKIYSVWGGCLKFLGLNNSMPFISPPSVSCLKKWDLDQRTKGWFC